MKKFIKYMVIAVGALLVTGIGYFAPSFFYKIPSSTEQNAFMQRFVNQFHSEKKGVFQPMYNAYLEKKVKDVLIPFLGEDSVQAVVRAELEVQRRKVAKEETSAFPLLNSNDKLNRADSAKAENQITNYRVKRTDAFIFLARSTDEERNRLFQLKKNDLLRSVRIIIGSETQRGDVFQVMDFPSSFSFTFASSRKIQNERLIAVTLIMAAVLLLFLTVILPAFMNKHRFRFKFSPFRHFETENIYRRQIVGTPEENLLSQVQTLCFQMPEIAAASLKSRLYDRPVFKSTTESNFSPAQQAAIILMCLGNQGVKLIFKQMNENEIKVFQHIISRLGQVKAIEIHPILIRFYRQLMHPQDVVIPKEQTKALIRVNVTEERVHGLIKEMEKPVFGKSIWEKLHKIPDNKISTFLAHEYPQTSAEILYHMATEKATQVLNAFSYRLAAVILLRISAFNYKIASSGNLLSAGNLNKQDETNSLTNGEIKAAAVLSLTEPARRKKILKHMAQTAPQAADNLSKHFVTFDDFALWRAADLRCLLKQTDEKTLIIALANASDNVKEVFARVIAPKKWIEILQKTISSPTDSVQKIEAAQMRMIHKAQLLVDTRKCKGKFL